MKTERFENILSERLKKCIDTLSVKANEYATEDRLHNFKVAAELQNCTPITALAGMMAKHTVSVYDLIQKQEQGYVVTREMWEEKIGDSINYLILLSALVEEKFDEETEGASCSATPAADVTGLTEYMKDESARLEKWAEDIRSHDSADTYKAGYEHGRCAGAQELARTVSLYLSGGKE